MAKEDNRRQLSMVYPELHGSGLRVAGALRKTYPRSVALR